MASLNKRVLITGALGFTGRYMVAEMQSAGYSVFELGTKCCSKENYYKVDLRSSLDLTEVVRKVSPDLVIHLAAISFVGHGDINSFYEVNVIGTRNLLNALVGLERPPEAVLLASSANIYGNVSEVVLAEDTIPCPANDYAVSKLAMEYMAKLWMPRLPIIIVRPFNYSGIGQSESFLLPKIVSHFRQELPVIELGNLDVWRDFSDVRFIVSIYRRLLECSENALGKTINVCSEKEYSLRDVIEMCTAFSGHSIKVKVNPKFVRSNEIKTLRGSSARLREIIGDYSVTPLSETLYWMLGE